MSTPISPANPEPPRDAGIEEIKQDIEHTREELGETVEALTAKLDVKTQARRKAESLKSRARNRISYGQEQARGAVAYSRSELDRIAGRVRTYRAENQTQSQALLTGACATAGAIITIMLWRTLRRRPAAAVVIKADRNTRGRQGGPLPTL